MLLFVFAASAGYWYFVWKAKRPELLEARAKETELWSTLETKARKAANLQAYKDQLAEMEKSFGAMLRQLPNKTEVPNLLVDISQTGLAAGLEEKLFQPQGENPQGLLRRAADRDPPDRQLPRDGQLRERHRGAAAHRHAARHRDRAGRRARCARRAVPGDLTLNVTAKTYRYLDEEEQACQAAAARATRRQAEGQEARRRRLRQPWRRPRCT